MRALSKVKRFIVINRSVTSIISIQVLVILGLQYVKLLDMLLELVMPIRLLSLKGDMHFPNVLRI